VAGLKFTLEMKGFKNIGTRMAAASKRASHALAIRVAEDTEIYVPAKSKDLVDDTKVKEDEIIYPGPYAHYLYVGKLRVDPDTGSPWAPKGATKVLDPGGRDLDIKKSVHSKAQAHWFEASKAQNLPKWIRFLGEALEREFGR